jgi:hypothetical protein
LRSKTTFKGATSRLEVLHVSAALFICRLSDDHKRAQRLANLVNIHGEGTFSTDYHEQFSTNLIFVKVRGEIPFASNDVVARLDRVGEGEAAELGSITRVRAMVFSRHEFRLAIQLNVGETEFRRAMEKVVYVLQEFNEMRKMKKIERGADAEVENKPTVKSRAVTVV